MTIKLIFFDTFRRTPSKIIIIFLCYIVIGHFSPRFKIIKDMKRFSFKEVDNRRQYAYVKALELMK